MSFWLKTSSRCITCRKHLTTTSMKVFNRDAKRRHRDLMAASESIETYEYLRVEMAERLSDRLADITRQFSRALDLGCGRGYLSSIVDGDDIKELYQCELSSLLLNRVLPSKISNTKSFHMDEEKIEFEKDFFDLVMTCGSLHWVNDLPGLMHRVIRTLVPDGVFLGSLLGGDTLFELRTALQLAEQEVENGFGPHVSPMVNMPDMGRLLHSAGFKMITIDVDEICVRYPDMHSLMVDLGRMGEGNCAWNRKPSLRRDTMKVAAEKYKEMYGTEDSIPATFQTINFIGWKPHPSQPKAKPRGSAEVSFMDHFNQQSNSNKDGDRN